MTRSHKAKQAEEEKILFDAFLCGCPAFAGEKIVAANPADADPPDYTCVTASGRRVGVEICQLANPSELSAGKRRERIVSNLTDAIGHPQPVNQSKRFWLVVFCPKAEARIASPEYAAFREAMFALIEHVENEWSPKVQGPHYRFRELARFPPLDRYLEQVLFAPGGGMASGIDWIVPIGVAKWFNDDLPAQLMLELPQKKRERCRILATECESLYLVVAHFEALLHGTPLTIGGVQNLVKKAREALAEDRGPFNGAFFFAAVEPSRRVHRVL